VVGGEVVHEVHHVALEVVGVAKKYEFHFFPSCWVGAKCKIDFLARVVT
jgi:hypothetical protein